MIFGRTLDKCKACGSQSKLEGFGEIHGITFDKLEGSPMICEKCFFHVIGFYGKWEWEKNIRINEKETLQ